MFSSGKDGSNRYGLWGGGFFGDRGEGIIVACREIVADGCMTEEKAVKAARICSYMNLKLLWDCNTLFEHNYWVL